MLVRGDRSREIVGHFGADLAIGGLSEASFSIASIEVSIRPLRVPDLLGSARISGDLYDARWAINGDMGGLAVAGYVEDVVVRTTGSMGAISFGAILNSDFMAGVDSEVARRAETPDDIINSAASIRSISMTNRALDSEGNMPFFANSNFSASEIGRVSLVNLIPSNYEETFGLYAGVIQSISNRNTETGDTWTWRKETDGALQIEDFFADAFAVDSPEYTER